MTPLHRLPHLWKHALVMLLVGVVLTSLLVYMYAQKHYTGSMEIEYRAHWNAIQELRQTLIHLAEKYPALPDVLEAERLQIGHIFLQIFRQTPQIFRLSLLDIQGNILFGRETMKMTDFLQTASSPSPHKMSRLRTRNEQFAKYAEKVHIVQLPLSIRNQQVGFLRGEFFLAESGTVFIQIARVTLWLVTLASIMIIILGIGLILSQVSHHVSSKQRQLEAYVVSLQRANEELRKTRKELQISEKLAALGYLAAGIAHEIGNPLSAILGYVELLQRKSLAPETMHDILSRLHHEIERIRSIIQELVTFSRPQSLNRQILDVNAVLHKTVSQLHIDPGKTIDIQMRLTEFPLLADGDAHKLQHVFLNILGNAVAAILSTGQIQISTSRRIRESGTMIGGSEVIAIEFRDSGCGIPKEHLDKVFDPFFSTKDPGQGMGLGLSLCHRIIESLHGEMDITSSEGEGTIVTVFLPPIRRAVSPES